MELHEAEKLAHELIGKKHLLYREGWSFKFDNAKTRLGSCQHRSKEITLSRHVTLVNKESSIRNTLLHEIAHALVGRGHGHDWVWRAKALEIGCNGDRCSMIEGEIPSKWIAECHGCGTIRTAHRKVTRTRSCGKCSGGTFNSKYLIEYKLNEELI